MLLLALAAGLTLAGVAASEASAQSNSFKTTVAFLCYSKFEVDPGVWALQGNRDTASDLLASGSYWSPYAEKTVPTATLLPGGYYLNCNLPAGMIPELGTLPKYDATPRPLLLTQKGGLIEMSPKYAGEPGLYPVAAA
jgi:hypothetical protein